MKIAMIGHKRIPSREGGVEQVVEELATRMVMLGHDVTVFNRKGNHVAGEQEEKEVNAKSYKGVRMITVPTSQKKALNAVLYSFFATIRASFGSFDVIHFHAEGPCMMIPIAKLFRKRCVATIHGLDWQRAKWGGFATKMLLFGEKMAAKHADEIIVLSENMQQYFRDTYQRKTVFIPNGITIPKHREAKLIQDRYGLQAENYLLFLARIVPEKGLDYLIDAYKELETDMPLVIAGGKSHSEDYFKQIEDKVREDHRIIMTGFLQGQALEELFSNCFLYILPSDIEGLPISLLEALSYGRKCVVSNIAENTSVIDQNSISFRKGNVESLREVLKKELAYTQGQRNREEESAQRIAYVESKYNWDEVVAQTVLLY